MVLIHKWDLFHVFIFGKIGKKKVFDDILERKMAFIAYKNKEKKGFVHGFGQKMGFFPRFHRWQNRHWNKKTPFKAIKTKSSNSRKTDISQKGLTDGFGPEMAIFEPFLFRQYRPGKCF